MTALAVSPALAPGKAAPYVIAAYAVFLAIVLIYVAIMARRLTKTERDLAELKRDVEQAAALEASEGEVQEAAPADERDWRRDPEIVS
jgi:type II secretory pathway component PulM